MTSGNRIVVMFCLLMFLSVFISASPAQENETVKLPPADMPPIPEEQELVDAVFAGFPGINRGAVVEMMGSNFKAELSDFRRIGILDSGRAIGILHNAVREAVRLGEIKEKDPDLYAKMVLQKQFDEKSAQLAAEYRRVQGDAKGAVMAELRKVLEAAFNLKQELMKKDVQQMQEELGRLKDLIDKRQENRDAIIGKRLGELTVETGYLEW